MTAILVCIALAAACNGVMDILQFRWDQSIFKKYPKYFKEAFWNPKISWLNKWKTSDGKVLVGTEKFWGSSRWFVFLTDGWHLMQWFMVSFFALAVQNTTFKFEPWELSWWLGTLIIQILIHVTWGLSFTLFFDYLLKAKKKE